MMGVGLGPVALMRPVAIFGALIGAGMAVVMLVLVPYAGAILAERTQAIRSDLANALIVERQFMHPTDGLTLFIADTSRAGEMAGIFLHDQRDPERPVTYSAERALLVREGDEARLVMLDGVALAPGAGGRELNAVEFDQFVFDLSELIRDEGMPGPAPGRVPDRARCSTRRPAMLATDRYGLSDYLAEGHYKLAMPLLATIYPMIALVTLLAGGYRRSGLRAAGDRGDRRGGAPAGGDVPRPRAGAGRGGALAAALPAGAARPPSMSGALLVRLSRGRRPQGAPGVTLWGYILRCFLRALAGTFAVIALVVVLFGYVENLRRFGETEAGIGDIVWITLLHAPEVLYQVFPLVLMLASLVTFLRLARASELVVMRAAGRRRAPADRGAGAGGGAARRGLRRRRSTPSSPPRSSAGWRSRTSSATPARASSRSRREGVWLRQADPEGQTVIQAARTNADGTILSRVRMHRFDEDGAPYARIEAPAARLTPGAWVLEQAMAWERDRRRPVRPHRRSPRASACRPSSPPSRSSTASRRPRPSASGTSAASSPRWRNSGFSGQRHRLFLASELAKPALFAAMVLIGAAFALRPTRFGQTGVMILLAVLAGFALYFLKDFAESLGAPRPDPAAGRRLDPARCRDPAGGRAAPAPRGWLSAPPPRSGAALAAGLVLAPGPLGAGAAACPPTLIADEVTLRPRDRRADRGGRGRGPLPGPGAARPAHRLRRARRRDPRRGPARPHRPGGRRADRRRGGADPRPRRGADRGRAAPDRRPAAARRRGGAPHRRPLHLALPHRRQHLHDLRREPDPDLGDPRRARHPGRRGAAHLLRGRPRRGLRAADRLPAVAQHPRAGRRAGERVPRRPSTSSSQTSTASASASPTTACSAPPRTRPSPRS